MSKNFYRFPCDPVWKAGIQNQEQLKIEAIRLIKYFLASLTIPEKDLWVNLSPYEKDRIIPQSFGLTEMGRDLLAEDYMLKQITASLIYPEDGIGKKFWKRIYEEAAKKYGTTNIPVNTFNKAWIVPEKAVVYENVKAGTAYIVESKLKVMLEQDYLSLEKNSIKNLSFPNASVGNPEHGNALNHRLKHSEVTDVSGLSSQIVREIVIPELTKEVNEGKNFAKLRQVYQSLILAIWYKKKIKDSILSQVYADKNKTAGVQYTSTVIPKSFTVIPAKAGIQNRINSDMDPRRTTVSVGQYDVRGDDVDLIYQRYLQAFKKGVYNYIKEEPDPITNQPIPRKYFSGGVTFLDSAMVTFTSKAPQDVPSNRNKVMVTANLRGYRDAGVMKDSAMTGTKMSPEETVDLMVRWEYERSFYDATNQQIILLNANRLLFKDGVRAGVEKQEKDITLQVKELSDIDDFKTGLIDDFKKGLKLKDLEIKAITLNSASRESGIYGVAVNGIAYVREDILKRSTATQLAEVIQRMALLVPKYKDMPFDKLNSGFADLKKLLDTIEGDKGASDTEHAEAMVNQLSIPSVAELLSLLQKERVLIVAVGFGQLGYGLLLSPYERIDYMAKVLKGHKFTEFEKEQFSEEQVVKGIFIEKSDNLLGEIAKTLRIDKTKLVADLLQEGNLSLYIPYLDRFFVIDKSSKDQHKGIMKVVFHVLEGYHGYNSRTVEFSEVVNDFERLMFYPVDDLEKFEGYSTKWSLEEKKALYKRYVIDLNLDPNTEMRSIIEALLRDFEQDIEIQIGNKSLRLSDIFYKGKLSERKQPGSAEVYIPVSAGTVSGTKRTRYEHETSVYLRDLMGKELFSKYSPLFPNWQPINKVVRPSVMFPSSAMEKHDDDWERITGFIDTAVKQQSNVRIVVQPIRMAAKDFYTYGDLCYFTGKIHSYRIGNKTISLRIKEGNEYKDYGFALSGEMRNEPWLEGIIYKIEVEDKAMLAASPGGIDLTPANMNLQTKVDSRFHGNDSRENGNDRRSNGNDNGEGSNGINFTMSKEQGLLLEQLQNTPGFIPVIIKIQPVDLRTFLGLADNQSTAQAI